MLNGVSMVEQGLKLKFGLQVVQLIAAPEEEQPSATDPVRPLFTKWASSGTTGARGFLQTKSSLACPPEQLV